MILGFLAMIVANAATVLGARSLLRFVRVGRPATDAVLFLLLRFLLISAAVLVAGAARGLNPTVLGLAGAVALAALVARGQHRGLLPIERPAWDRWIVAAVALLALRLLLQAWFFAPYAGDALYYHLPKVAEWVHGGAITRETGADLRSLHPAGFEVYEIWWTVFLHHDVLIEMAGIEFLVLAGAAAYALARELGWSTNVAALSGLLFVMTPGLHLQATACLNDGPVAALVVATLALIVAKAHPLLLLLPVGLGTGIKPTFVYALPGLALTWVLLRKKPGSPLPSARLTAGLVATALGVGAVWYLRNWALYGSPIYPVGWEGLKTPTGGHLQRLGPSLRGLRENLACFLDIRVYDRVQPADPICAGNFNWGAAAFALGAPALIALLRREAALRPIAIGLTASLLSVFTLVELDPWYARFVFFFPVLTSLALARLWESERWIAVLGGLALASTFLASGVPDSLREGALAGLAKQSWSARAADPPPKASLDGSPVGFLCENFGNGYSLYGPDFSHRVVYLRDDVLEDLLAHAERERLSFFYTDAALRKKLPMLDEGVRRGRLKPFAVGAWKGYEILPAR
jgi:hypothetical protein